MPRKLRIPLPSTPKDSQHDKPVGKPSRQILGLFSSSHDTSHHPFNGASNGNL